MPGIINEEYQVVSQEIESSCINCSKNLKDVKEFQAALHDLPAKTDEEGKEKKLQIPSTCPLCSVELDLDLTKTLPNQEEDEQDKVSPLQASNSPKGDKKTVKYTEENVQEGIYPNPPPNTPEETNKKSQKKRKSIRKVKVVDNEAEKEENEVMVKEALDAKEKNEILVPVKPRRFNFLRKCLDKLEIPKHWKMVKKCLPFVIPVFAAYFFMFPATGALILKISIKLILTLILILIGFLSVILVVSFSILGFCGIVLKGFIDSSFLRIDSS